MPKTVEVSLHPDLALDPAAVEREALRRARLRIKDVAGHRVLRKSIDARGGKVRLQLQVELRLRGEVLPQVVPVAPVLPPLRGEPEVAIIGAGPAGLFCAWSLALAGIRSIILERGKTVRGRRRDLAALMRRGELDPDSNYGFGEGGAGTFSDGKLYTRSSKRGEVRQVLEVFVAHGASPEILVDARPHIGTNRLPAVIERLRSHLESAGVRVVFEARVEALRVAERAVTGVRLADGSEVSARAVVVASGHSASDVQRFCHAAGALVEFKPFAMGVRIEHAQALIDAQQFGDLAGHPALGSASYRIVEQIGGVGVFSFCMCPGGFIAPAATDAGAQVVNGWSPSNRNGRYANSGFVVEIGVDHLASLGCDPLDPFAGILAQRTLEQLAYQAGGGSFVGPAQTLSDFVAGRMSAALPPCSYPRGLQAAPLHELLGVLARPLQEALRRIDERMPGFVSENAVAVGVESRTSSPVRIVRDDDLQSPSLRGLYPCGEGAGHAGGIVSAALDGIATAERIAQGLRSASRR